jgi:hypothetical protein
LPTIRKYIDNQQHHHNEISPEDEYLKYLDDFLENGPEE